MPNQEIDNNEIEDSNNVNLSEIVNNIYLNKALERLTKNCRQVRIEYYKDSISITGSYCGCSNRVKPN